MSSRYKVTRTVTETVVVDQESPSDALESALDYGHQYDWSAESTSYTVEEL